MIKKILEKYKINTNKKKAIPTYFPFVMYEEEKEIFKKYIQNSKGYIEFGLGGSTISSLINSQTIIHSVDTNDSWINFMKEYKIIQDNLDKRLHIYKVDIGPTKSWGYPIDDSRKDSYKIFSSKIFSEVDLTLIDTILVDGRFRIACTLNTVLNFHDLKEVNILIHDYSLREDYKIVEKYLDLKEKTKTLYVFKIKENIDVSNLKNDILKFENNLD